jgi:predicted nucleic acid-binding protein
MKVLVDTSVWSLALRRREGQAPEARELAALVADGLVAIIGPIRQEILSGISQPRQFESLQADLAAFEDHPLSRTHFETGAIFFNKCRKHGIQGSHTDFLICAVASLEKMAIFSTDRDFERYLKYLPITLHLPRKPA